MLVSIVHYTDNYANYSDYPHGSGPEPSAAVILGAWFVFTPIGLAGYLLYRHGQVRAGSLCLLAYSGSGLVGIGHYVLVSGMTAQPVWRQAHVIADILLGASIFAFALWSILALPKSYETLARS